MQPTPRIVSPLIVLLALLIPLTAYAGDLNADLLKAAKEGRTGAVKALIAKGADVNAKDKRGQTPLMLAARGSIFYPAQSETVQALIAAGADVDAKDKLGRTALMLAGVMGRTATVKPLLEAGADVDAKDNGGRTALMSVTRQHLYNLNKGGQDYLGEIIQLLKQAGAKE